MTTEIISINAWELIVAAGNLLVLYFILNKLLFKRVANIIKVREDEVSNIYNDANKTKEDALKLKAEYNESIKNAKDKALEIVNTATANATKKSDEIINDANKEAHLIKQKAEASILLERKKVINELQGEISNIVTEAASKVIEREINEQDHKKLIDDFIAKVGE